MERKIVVLMSTYNGSLFLQEQIESILAQNNVNLRIVIRDDGSSDKTVCVLKKYKEYPNIDVISEENIGVEQSFRKLVNLSLKYDAEYFAFSDQDDYWQANKLIKAIELLEKENSNIPLLYCSNLEVVDVNLMHINFMSEIKDMYINKNRALVENIAFGCTCVFNKNARDLFLNYEPQYTTIHDFWMYLICSYIGKVIYDKNSYILYRQHSKNTIGADRNIWNRWRKRIRSFEKLKDTPRENRSKDLLDGFRDILFEEDILTIGIVANYRKSIKHKLKFLFSRKIRMSSREKNFWLKIRIIFNSV